MVKSVRDEEDFPKMSLINTSIISKIFPDDDKFEEILSKLPENILKNNSKIMTFLKTKENFSGHFEDCKELFTELKSKILSLRTSMEKGESQVKAMDVVIRHGIQNYDDIRELKGKIKGKLNEDERSYEELVAKFNSAIVVLEKTELHPSLQKEGKTFLSNVYYSKEKMQDWKDKCVRKKENLREIFKGFLEEIKDIKEFIKKQKVSKVHKNKELKNNRIQEINDNVYNLEVQTEKAVKMIYNRYLSYKTELGNLLSVFIQDDNQRQFDYSEELLQKVEKLYNAVENNLENKSKDLDRKSVV